jgi:hypothetical protein
MLEEMAEHMPAATGCLDVSDTKLQMPFAAVAVIDECGVRGDSAPKLRMKENRRSKKEVTSRATGSTIPWCGTDIATSRRSV